MQSRSELRFLDCRLDLDEARLLRGSEAVALRPKTFALLAYLAQRPGRLVSKRELLDAVWTETAVSDWVLTTSIKELRQALGDDAASRRIIETLHRRGYRFLPDVHGAGRDGEPDFSRQPAGEFVVVGRDRELGMLAHCFAQAAAGARQIVFVVGEAGIGKTTLVDEFLHRLGGAATGDTIAPGADARSSRCLVARGQCVAQHGAGEPYMPVLEALSGLCRGTRGGELVELLERYAPSWLVELADVLDPDGQRALRARLPQRTRESMLREATIFFAQLPFPVALVLEDLHWSDFGTLELLSSLAGRRDAARLLVLGTYRPVEVATQTHPLRSLHREMQARRSCVDVWLEHLSTDDIEAYLESRWPGLADCERHAQVIAARTDGNPLFIVHLLDHLVATGALKLRDGSWCMQDRLSDASIELPRGLRAMIATSLDRLELGDRSMLQAAAAIGRQFRADLIAWVTDADRHEVEERLARLTVGHLIVRRAGERDRRGGGAPELFELTHALYQQELYRELPAGRRTVLHSRIAQWLEQSLGERKSEIAIELAYHFEAAGEVDRAVEALREAANRAFARAAHRDGIALLDHALAVLDASPVSPERELAKIRVCIESGAAASQSGSFGDPRAESAFLRARTMAEHIADLPQRMQATFGLAGFFIATAQLRKARGLIDELNATAEQLPFPVVRFGAVLQEGIWQYHAGSLEAARRSFESALLIEGFPVSGVTQDLHCMVLNYLALVQVHLGDTGIALGSLAESRARAERIGNPLDVAQSAMFDCFVHAMLEDDRALSEVSGRAIDLATRFGAPNAESVARVCQGFLRARRGEAAGLDDVRLSLKSYRETNQRIALPFLLGVKTQAAMVLGDLDSAERAIAETRRLIEQTSERRFAADATRLAGVLRLRRGDRIGAETELGLALEIARADGSRLWEQKTLRVLEGLRAEHG